MKQMSDILQTFLELAAIDEVYPNESQVLAYVKKRLTAADIMYQQDEAGNIVARIDGQGSETIAICGHVDIAAPLLGRQIVREDDIIKTDGRGLLGGDDKTIIAAMLELADYVKHQSEQPMKTVELLFTVGEEAGLKGAQAFHQDLMQAKDVLVFDWVGGVNHIITESPAYVCVDVTYHGQDAHPAEWQHGKNAGAGLMAVASSLTQGEYAPDVTFNIGLVQIGNARNKVPGTASLKAEIRGFDAEKVTTAAKSIEVAFTDGATQYDLSATVEVLKQCSAFKLDTQGALLKNIQAVLGQMHLSPVFESTYGCFDGNVFAERGCQVVILGAAYYNPHSPAEYVKISELRQMLVFLQKFVAN